MSKFLCVCCLKKKKSPPFQCQWCDRLWCNYCTARAKGDSTPYSCREGFGCSVLPTPRGCSSPSPHPSPYSPQSSPIHFQGSQSPPSSSAPSPASSWDFPSQATLSQPTSPVSPTPQHPTYSPSPKPAAPSPSSPSQNGRSSPSPPSHKRRRSIAADFFSHYPPHPPPLKSRLTRLSLTLPPKTSP